LSPVGEKEADFAAARYYLGRVAFDEKKYDDASDYFEEAVEANDKVADYLLGGGEEFNDQFSSLGFRWDFLLYSATGVFAGWYFIFVKKIEDKLYIQIYNIYVLVNAFWVLVIRASFSNRFAYLSWFLLGVVIIYPLLKKQIFEKQHVLIGRIIFLYFAFTYVLNVLLVKAK
jgi:tetratricopeptide (TPR) repeat protein